MADAEREDSYYNPGGVPITPQARRFGYEFPVYVSEGVWRDVCVPQGIASRHAQNLEQRIWHLLQYCYEGMTKKLATEDDFLQYFFKIWYWPRYRPDARKKARARLGARLFLDPSTEGPWLYIFNPRVDDIDALTRGEPDEQSGETGEAADAISQISEGSGELSPRPQTGPDLYEDPTRDSEFGEGDPGDHVGPPEMYK
jgi:hypothetical protein